MLILDIDLILEEYDRIIHVCSFGFVHREEDLSPMDTWWPHEKNRGVRDVDIIRGRIAAAGPDAGLLDVLRGPYKEGELPIPPPSK